MLIHFLLSQVRKGLFGFISISILFATLYSGNVPVVRAQEVDAKMPMPKPAATSALATSNTSATTTNNSTLEENIAVEVSGKPLPELSESVINTNIPIFFDNLKQASPNGMYVALVSANDLSMDGSIIWVANSDETDIHSVVLGDHDSWVTNPIWSPDGNELAYLKIIPQDVTQFDVRVKFEIWKVRKNGSYKTLVTDTFLLNPELGYGGKSDIRWNLNNEIEFFNNLEFPVKQYAVNLDSNSIREIDTVSPPEVISLSQPSNVPHFYQTDSAWSGNQLGTCSTTIGASGCAITATAMVFKYFGVSTDPGALNTWLKNNGGYASGCLINWTTASNINSNITYLGNPGQDWNRLKSEIDSGYPIIVEVNNNGTQHFVVVTGYSGSTYYINDPAYSSRTTLASYGNSFVGMRIFHGPINGGGGTGLDCGQVSYNGVILYENTTCNKDQNGKTKSFSSSTGWTDIVSDFNDITSSLYVGSGWSIKVYQNSVAEGGGSWRCINQSMWDLSRDYYTNGDTGRKIDNDISSVQVYHNSNCSSGSPPSIPTNLRNSSSTQTSITMSWDDVSNETGYKIYEWNGSTFVYLASVGANTTSYTETRSNCGWDEFYTVSAYNSYWESSQSDWEQGFTQSCPVTPNAPSLSSPANGYTFNEGDNINLSWSATGNEYYGEVWGGPGGTLTFGWQGAITKSMGPQWAGHTYSWHVKARIGSGESGWSSTWNFTVRPAAPSNLSATAVSCSQINLSWSDNSGNEEGYKVYRGGTLVATLGSGTTSYQNTGLAGNTSYSYVVKAYRGGIESNSSNTASATTATCGTAPSMPSNPNPADGATLGRTNDTTLSWSTNGSSCSIHVWGGSINITPTGGCSSLHLGQQRGGAYSWQVTSNNSYGSTSGPTWHFNIRPYAPTNMTASVVSSSQINLSWTLSSDEPNDIDSYDVYDISGAKIGSVPKGTNTYQAGGLSCNTTYAFYVKSVRQGVSSSISNTTSATTQSCQSGVRATDVWIADWNWDPKTSFNVGDSIRWIIDVENTTGSTKSTELKYVVTDPTGQVIVDSVGTYSIDAGDWSWGLPGTVANMGGTYTFTGYVTYQGSTTQYSTTYSVTGPMQTFSDVPPSHMFNRHIEAFYDAGITVGCMQSPRLYCPDNPVTRGEMAVFIERAMGNFTPAPSPTGMFSDLPYPGMASFTPFIEEFYNDEITVGCTQSPLRYCPQNYVTRGEMAVFIERALGNFSPTPSPTGMFADVLPGNPFKPFIEEFYNDGITVGCTQSPLRYCPQNYVTRGEMAVFIVRAFGIPLP